MTLNKAQKWSAIIAASVAILSGGISGTIAFVKSATGSDEIRSDIKEIKRSLNFQTERLGRTDERVSLIYRLLKFNLGEPEREGALNEKRERYYAGSHSNSTNTVQ